MGHSTDEKLIRLDARVGEVEKRLDRELNPLPERVTVLESRFDGIDREIKGLSQKVEDFKHEIKEEVKSIGAETSKKIEKITDHIRTEFKENRKSNRNIMLWLMGILISVVVSLVIGLTDVSKSFQKVNDKVFDVKERVIRIEERDVSNDNNKP